LVGGPAGCPAWQRLAMTPNASPWCLPWNGIFGGYTHQHSPSSRKVCHSWFRMPKHPDAGRLLVSEIEDLPAFTEVAFLEGRLCVSRVWVASCDDAQAPFDLPGASWAPGLPGGLPQTVRSSMEVDGHEPFLTTFPSASRRGGKLKSKVRSCLLSHPGPYGSGDDTLRLVPKHNFALLPKHGAF
jgi:hypothetical protein